MAADEACEAIFWPTPGYEKKTFDSSMSFAQWTFSSADTVPPPLRQAE